MPWKEYNVLADADADVSRLKGRTSLLFFREKEKFSSSVENYIPPPQQLQGKVAGLEPKFARLFL